MKTQCIIGMAGLLFTVTSFAQQATVTVAPELTDEILANPGMGWQTFHHTANQDKNLPDWIPSTIHYARWGWGELELQELKHPTVVRAGQTLGLAMRWRNTGSAPCYRPYRIACRLSNAAGQAAVLVGQSTVEKWLPGSIELFHDAFFRTPADLPPGAAHEVTERLVLPPDLPNGRYRLSIGVVDANEKPVVRLGIAGRDEAGWYPLSHVSLER